MFRKRKTDVRVGLAINLMLMFCAAFFGLFTIGAKRRGQAMGQTNLATCRYPSQQVCRLPRPNMCRAGAQYCRPNQTGWTECADAP